MKIQQDAAIAIQIAKALQGHEGPLNLTINLNNGIGNTEINSDSISKPLPIEDEALLAYIETFPPPKLQNFFKRVRHLVVERFGSGDREWLSSNTLTPEYTIEEVVSALEKANWRLAYAAASLGMGPYRVRQMCDEFGILHPRGSWRKWGKRNLLPEKVNSHE